MQKKIYLAGSFYDFRDRIISALPDFNFADPRKHRQHAVAPLVEDDIGEAEECPILLACFPKGKKRGVMTYAEIGASRISGNYIITADENEEKDSLLENISDSHFGAIEKSIEFLKNNKDLNFKSRYERIIKQNTVLDKIDNVFIASNQKFLEKEIEVLKRKGKNIVTYESLKGFDQFKNIDLTIVAFPEIGDWERKAIFFMGVSYSLKIPIAMRDEKEVPYPPLNGLIRRVFRSERSIVDYLNQLESQDSDLEAQLCYKLFTKYDHIK